MARWQTERLHLDPRPAMEALGFAPDDIEAAIHDTVRATLRRGRQEPARLASSSPR